MPATTGNANADVGCASRALGHHWTLGDRDIEVTVNAWQGNGKRVERYRFVRTPPGCGPPLQLLDIRLGPERVFY